MSRAPTNATRAQIPALRRVLFVTQLPPPYGGLTVHSERLRATLERLGVRVEVLTPPTARTRALDRRRFRRLRLVAEQVAFLRRVATTPCDLVHDHISTYAVGARGAVTVALHLALLVALGVGRRPWVASCGNGLLPSMVAATSPARLRVYRALFRRVASAIAKNERIAGAFADLGLAARVRVVGTFLEPVASPAERPLPDAVARFFAAHPTTVVTAGFRFEPLYHLADVARAMADVRRHHVSRGIAGPVGLVVLASEAEDPAGRAAFDAALDDPQHVLVLRDVDYALAVVARGAAFVRATDFDGDANTVKEAMMLGVPVLATDLPGRPPGIELVDRVDPQTLAARLLDLLAKPDPARQAANRDFVQRDIARNTADILAVYAAARGR